MYDEEIRTAARAAMASGESLNSISKLLGVSRSALREWRDRPVSSSPRPTACPRCYPTYTSLPANAYAHLLGLYLGDGCISLLKKGVYSLRIACDNAYPRLISEAVDVLEAVHPGRRAYRVSAVGYTSVVSYWKHWPCLFPQHGAGPKHLRRIELAGWQQEIVAEHPGLLLRGLINSDGCRITNWTTRPVAGRIKRYEYPRYFFSNESADIMAICQEALDLLGIAWRMPRRNALSVARREAVAALDLHVGPKS